MNKEIKTAVILAAGMGTRLEGAIGEKPKGFMKFGQKPIIEESIDCLNQHGITTVYIVAGYCAAYYQQLASRIKGVTVIINQQYASCGSLYSLCCAQRIVSDDFLLLESDIIFETRAITGLLNSSYSDAVLVSGFTQSGDEVFIEQNNLFLVNMSHDKKALKNNYGEFVGISRISLDTYRCLLVESQSSLCRQWKYEVGLVKAAGQTPIFCHKIDDLIWAEVDDQGQYERVKNRVYQELQSRL